jgi:hypothetical protein
VERGEAWPPIRFGRFFDHVPGVTSDLFRDRPLWL